MSTYDWQKSSYSGEAANCLNLAVADNGTIKLRESDLPEEIVTVTTAQLKSFLLSMKIGSFDTLTGDH